MDCCARILEATATGCYFIAKVLDYLDNFFWNFGETLNDFAFWLKR